MQDFSTFSPIEGISATVTKTSISITNTQESETWIIGTAISNYVNQEWKVYVESDNDISNLSFQFHVNQSNIVTVGLQKGINTIPTQTFTDQTRAIISVPVGVSVTLTQIPNEVANERDIELFNFGYSKQSGFNGYVQDFRNWSRTDESATIVKTEESLKISGNTGGWVVALWNVST